MRWSPTNPPPAEPPSELGLTDDTGARIWRLAAHWFREHYPVPHRHGEICAVCRRWWPCPGIISAEQTLIALTRQQLRKRSR